MASGDDAVKIVDPKDLADDGPMVRVDSVEKTSLFAFLKGGHKEDNGVMKPENAKPAPSTGKKEHESCAEQKHKGVVHEGSGVKTTYDVEDDGPTYLEQAKRAVHWNGR